jgi:penicillin-binding protein 2
VDVAPRVLEEVRHALWGVVKDRGTGQGARLDDVEIAGKTGTVQVVRQATWTDNRDLDYKLRDHAWFAAYGPATDPELAIVVFVEHGGHGSRAAGPLVKRLYETYFGVAESG